MKKQTLDLIKELEENNQSFEWYPTTDEILQVIYNNCYSGTFLDIGCGNAKLYSKFKEWTNVIKLEYENAKIHNLQFRELEDKISNCKSYIEEYLSTKGDNSEWYIGQYGQEKQAQAKLEKEQELKELENKLLDLKQKIGDKKEEKRSYVEITNYYAIEKSKILIERAPKDVIIVGTDFYQNTLIDKKVDVIFCNPPYSDYETWVCKIVKEANAQDIYLVIPERWKDNKEIQYYIKARNAKVSILGSFDFLNAERRARAKVNIVRINLQGTQNRYRDECDVDPFDIWFENEFKIKCEKQDKYSDYETEREERERKKAILENQIIASGNLIQTLVTFYSNDMNALYSNYKKLGELDSEIFKELNIDLKGLKEGLKLKVEGTKHRYWKELFDRLDTITNRLTTKSRKKLLEKLYSRTHVDFNEENIYAIVIWVIKNANHYFDEQLKEIFLQLTEPKNIKNYKSNQKTWHREEWRYNHDKKEQTHYTLDYRIIINSYDKCIINDMLTIANNLGFVANDNEHSTKSKTEVYLNNLDAKGKQILLMDYTCHKNNNIHFRLNKEFIKAFNIEASRLFGWIHNKEDIINEFDCELEIKQEDCDKYYKSSYKIETVPSQFLIEL